LRRRRRRRIGRRRRRSKGFAAEELGRERRQRLERVLRRDRLFDRFLPTRIPVSDIQHLVGEVQQHRRDILPAPGVPVRVGSEPSPDVCRGLPR